MGNLDGRIIRPEESGHRLSKWALTGVLLIVFLPILLVLIVVGVGSWIFRDDVTDHRKDWKAYYASHVSQDFYIPEAAEIVKAEDWSGFPMNWGYTVHFKLPETKTPEQWMIELVDRSPILDREDRSTRYIYELPGVYYRLEYMPQEDLYEAFHYFD